MRSGFARSLVFCLVVGCSLFAAEGRTLGYQLDVSRCKVPTMETLYRMVDMLASLGYNQFQLYTEHTFAYRGYEEVWAEASPMTPEEVRALDDHCARRGIELVPNQNSFGHMERWLRHPSCNGLAEFPQGGADIAHWGGFVTDAPKALCPTDPRCLGFLSCLYDQLLPCFRSRHFNVGCDEALEVVYARGGGRSAAAIAEKGGHRVYFDFLKQIHGLVAARGHTMMFWGDILLTSPELIDELPRDVVCLNWGYEADHPFEKQAAAFEKSGRRFIVCPGTSAWGSLFGRTDNMMQNIDNAVSAGERHGAEGVLLADWGDEGHPNPWIVSLPPIVYAANRARGVSLSRDELAGKLDALLGCRCGEALLAYGDVYRKCGGRTGNTTELFHLLRADDDYRPGRGVTRETLYDALSQCRRARALADLGGAPEWVKDDFAVLELLARAVETRIAEPGRKNFTALFEPEYRRLWLRQNRIGGLAESVARLFRPSKISPL